MAAQTSAENCLKTNMHEAKTHLSRLIAAAQRGQEVLICKNGKPVARIEALKDQGLDLDDLYGLTKGRIEAKAGWDAPLKEDVIEALFDGNHP